MDTWNGHEPLCTYIWYGTQVEDMSQLVGQPRHSGDRGDKRVKRVKGVLTKGDNLRYGELYDAGDDDRYAGRRT
jgi:hypothetical protein